MYIWPETVSTLVQVLGGAHVALPKELLDEKEEDEEEDDEDEEEDDEEEEEHEKKDERGR